MVLVFDIGATHTRLALASHGGLGEVWRMDTDTTAVGFARVLGALEEAAKGHKLAAVAGGIPGQLEGEDGRLALAPNLPDWVGLPVRARLTKLFDCPVYIFNDVEMGGLGESHDGAGISQGVMAYFTVSTGVNAVRIVDGRVDSSIERFEIGKFLIDTENGKPESLEALTGGAALAKRQGKPPRQVRDPAVWKAEERDLARGLYDVLISWTPELVVFGGSMMRDIDLKVVRRELEQLPSVMREWPRLEYAKLGDLGGLHGAVAWLEQQTKR
jgi:predicted NBD/HSP70 family sugar kinase